MTSNFGQTKASQDSVVQNTDVNILNKGGDIPAGVADVLGCKPSEEETYHLIFGEELASYGIILKTSKECSELENYNDNLRPISDVKLTGTDTIDISNSVLSSESKQVASNETMSNVETTLTPSSTLLVNVVEDTIKEVEKQSSKSKTKSRTVIKTNVNQSEALLQIDCATPNYAGAVVTLSPEDRDLLERLVMGEAGGEGFEGAALVAQAIRDTMVYKGFTSVNDVKTACGYSGSIKKTPNQNVKNAVAYVFDQGGIVVKHPIFYFYAPKMASSKFHESQKFIIEKGEHRFFSTWQNF